MVPARLSVLSKLIGPRRYTDPAYLQQVGAEIYGGAYRRDPALLKEHSRHIQAPRGRGYLYQLLAAAGWSSLPWLGGLRQRTLVMHGNDDPIVPLTNAKILAARIRDATLYVIDDGHLFLITRAKDVAPVVRKVSWAGGGLRFLTDGEEMAAARGGRCYLRSARQFA